MVLQGALLPYLDALWLNRFFFPVLLFALQHCLQHIPPVLRRGRDRRCEQAVQHEKRKGIRPNGSKPPDSPGGGQRFKRPHVGTSLQD